MATKLKNIKGIKIAAFILAVVMFLASGFFAGTFVRSAIHYAGDASKSYYETPSFRWQMNRFIDDMFYSARSLSVNSIDEFRKTSDGKEIDKRYDEKILEVSQAHDLLDKSGIVVHYDAQSRYRYSLTYNNITYYFLYNGSIISEAEFNSLDYVDYEDDVETLEDETYADSLPTAVDNNTIVYTQVHVYNPDESGSVPVYVKDISRALNTLFEVDDYTCYGEVKKVAFTDMLEVERQQEHEFRFYDISRSNTLINSVKNVNYAIFYKTGTVVSNCGIVATDTDAQIVEKLDANNYAEGMKNGKYILLKGSVLEENDSLFGVIRRWLFSEYYYKSELEAQSFLQGYTDDVTAAYFAIPQYKGIDAFFISEQAYNEFSSVKITSPSLLLALTFITFLLACAACIYLIAAAGKTADGIKINFTDKVPAEINWILGIGTMFCLGVAVFGIVVGEFDPMGIVHDLSNNGFSLSLAASIINSLSLITSELIAVCVAGFFMIWTALNMSLARNIRNKTFIKHTLCYLIIVLLFKLLKFVFKPFRKLFGWLWKKSKTTCEKFRFIFNCDYSKGQGTKFKIIACASALLFVILSIIYYFITGMLMSDSEEGIALMLLFFGFIGDLAILLFILLIVVSADRIFEAVNDIRNGNLNRTIDTKYMPPFMKRFAEDILSMQDGLQNAVESAVRDQRMKAELITNVSHDLKTPLTSIVTYVDLLKKCDIEGEDANKYVSILDEKAQKMKKLIEDLVEASKASSGAMEIHPVKINLCEFAAQAVGEHEDELKNKNIEILLKMPEEPVIVTADSQKTSRIVENLFSNIRKYAMEGTRAYVEVLGGAEYGTLVFKNISKEMLDISADELTQRFVRGDASRSGEGSGLGLSIAKNLCELQKGKLSVQIDGDLFKAMVVLPR